MKEQIQNLFKVIDEMSNSLAVMKADPQRNIILLKKLKVCANEIKDEYEAETKELDEFAVKIKEEAEKREREAKLFKDEEMRQSLQADIGPKKTDLFGPKELKEELLSDYLMDAR